MIVDNYYEKAGTANRKRSPSPQRMINSKAPSKESPVIQRNRSRSRSRSHSFERK